MKVYATGNWSKDYTWDGNRWVLKENTSPFGGIHSLMAAYPEHTFYDWASDEHNQKSPAGQMKAIDNAIRECDVFMLNLDGYEDRSAGGSFFQFAMAWILNKQIVLIDPLKHTRPPQGTCNADAPYVHQAFKHLYAAAVRDEARVQWVETLAQVRWL